MEIDYTFVRQPILIEPIELPKTLEHLDLGGMKIDDFTFPSNLILLKSLNLNWINFTTLTLHNIAKNCLELHTLRIDRKFT